MARFICEMEVETVGELKTLLATLADDMPVTDAVGELLLLRIYEEENKQFLEVA